MGFEDFFFSRCFQHVLGRLLGFGGGMFLLSVVVVIAVILNFQMAVYLKLLGYFLLKIDSEVEKKMLHFIWCFLKHKPTELL